MRLIRVKRAARSGLAAVALAASGIDLRAQAAAWCPPHSPHTVAARQAQGRPSRAALARIDSAVAAEMRREHIPGLSIAVVTDDQLRWERGYGFADLEACVPATPATVYRLASVSKTITAAAVMQLAEQGRFDLDAPIALRADVSDEDKPDNRAAVAQPSERHPALSGRRGAECARVPVAHGRACDL